MFFSHSNSEDKALDVKQAAKVTQLALVALFNHSMHKD
jgi:hypothetical protein